FLSFRRCWRSASACWCATGRSCRARSAACRSRRPFERRFDGVAFERPRGREFAQFVPDHLLGDVHGNELSPVVHRDGVANHVRQNRGAPRPRLDDFLFVPRVHPFDFYAKGLIDERAFFKRAWHLSSCPVLFTDAAQLYPLRAAHATKTAHRPRHTVRHRAERADKTCSLRVRRLLNNYCPARLANPVHHLRLGNDDFQFPSRLRRGANPLGSARGTPRGPASCSCGAHCSALDHPPRRDHLFWSPFSSASYRKQNRYGFRRWTISLSEGLRLRVFAPKVGKPHGVCGWSADARASACVPPCRT